MLQRSYYTNWELTLLQLAFGTSILGKGYVNPVSWILEYNDRQSVGLQKQQPPRGETWLTIKYKSAHCEYGNPTIMSLRSYFMDLVSVKGGNSRGLAGINWDTWG
uniref:Uncharacterized protein n=1 Tax=Vespula pensylvanica TaxID=30213 RepID=A0A834P545_VESPE|nr:hypothetical protein H0235_005572 [Vespula pensylvanica]